MSTAHVVSEVPRRHRPWRVAAVLGLSLPIVAWVVLATTGPDGIVSTIMGRAPELVPGKYFSTDYVTARNRFHAAVDRAGGRLTSLELTARGPAGEGLSIDIGWFGAEQPTRAFVHSSGVHGVEAFAGSAIQLQWLDEGLPEIPEDAAIGLVHVINPHGMAWLRRVNERGVDLNRNFLGPGEAYEGAPEGYEALDSFLNPPSPPSVDLFYLRAGWLILRVGIPALRQTIAGGQYLNPKGLFFGGTSLEEGPRRLQQYVQDRLADVKHLVVVDVHTGLGPFGVDTLLVHGAEESDSLFATMKRTFGDRVASMDPERGPAYRVKGAYDTMYQRTLPTAEVYFVNQEFGTSNVVQVVKALRAENRWHHYGGGGVDHTTKHDLRRAFVPEDDAWRQTALDRGRIVIRQALGLLTVGP